jgi:hypothetical protein
LTSKRKEERATEGGATAALRADVAAAKKRVVADDAAQRRAAETRQRAEQHGARARKEATQSAAVEKSAQKHALRLAKAAQRLSRKLAEAETRRESERTAAKAKAKAKADAAEQLVRARANAAQQRVAAEAAEAAAVVRAAAEAAQRVVPPPVAPPGPPPRAQPKRTKTKAKAKAQAKAQAQAQTNVQTNAQPKPMAGSSTEATRRSRARPKTLLRTRPAAAAMVDGGAAAQASAEAARHEAEQHFARLAEEVAALEKSTPVADFTESAFATDSADAGPPGAAAGGEAGGAAEGEGGAQRGAARTHAATVACDARARVVAPDAGELARLTEEVEALEELALAKGLDLSDLEARVFAVEARTAPGAERESAAAAAVALSAGTTLARDAAARGPRGAADAAPAEEQARPPADDATVAHGPRPSSDIALANALALGSRSDVGYAAPPAAPGPATREAPTGGGAAAGATGGGTGAATGGDQHSAPVPAASAAAWSQRDEHACEAIERLAPAQLHPLYAARYAPHTWDAMRRSASDVRALYDLGYTAEMLTEGTLPDVECTPWSQLTLHERRAAETIDFAAWRWDRRVEHALKLRLSNVVQRETGRPGLGGASTTTLPIRVDGGVAAQHDSQREAERAPRVARAVGATPSARSSSASEILVTDVRVNRNGSITFKRISDLPRAVAVGGGASAKVRGARAAEVDDLAQRTAQRRSAADALRARVEATIVSNRKMTEEHRTMHPQPHPLAPRGDGGFAPLTAWPDLLAGNAAARRAAGGGGDAARAAAESGGTTSVSRRHASAPEVRNGVIAQLNFLASPTAEMTSLLEGARACRGSTLSLSLSSRTPDPVLTPPPARAPPLLPRSTASQQPTAQ